VLKIWAGEAKRQREIISAHQHSCISPQNESLCGVGTLTAASEAMAHSATERFSSSTSISVPNSAAVLKVAARPGCLALEGGAITDRMVAAASPICQCPHRERMRERERVGCSVSGRPRRDARLGGCRHLDVSSTCGSSGHPRPQSLTTLHHDGAKGVVTRVSTEGGDPPSSSPVWVAARRPAR
jgi:hypothetical protein